MFIPKLKTETETGFLSGNLYAGQRKYNLPSDIKGNLGRSPDFADIMMMRMLFLLKEKAKINYVVVNNQKPKPNQAR